ncbi:MAG: CGNR zinc finger domain-containing protein, partial [Alphaproteobacteria bacterium]|nr:CGNR zinc finger domain-containing protein [Alphaproteobacteria bacterium]
AVSALLARAARDPDAAARVLADALALREAVARLAAGPAAPLPDDLARLNGHLAGADRLAAVAGGFAWTAGSADALASPLARVARDAADLLASPRLARVRRCADERCGWLFLDADRGPGRRWCSMTGCGNRAKARRHYRRRKVQLLPAAASGPGGA